MNIGKSIKKLVIKECANYDEVFNDIKDYCCLEWTKGYCCIFFIKENAECDYFERGVLPMNPQLEALYRAEHQAKEVGYELTKGDKENILEKESSIKGKVKIHCKNCGKIFQADNYRQKYCDYCKKFIKRKRWRENKDKERKINADVHTLALQNR